MWFRMSFNLLHSCVFAEVTMPRGKGDRAECRLSLLIQMLCAAAEGSTFESPEYLSRRFGVSLQNSEIVWNICIKHNALVRIGDSYSMNDWMTKQGIIGKLARSGLRAKPQPAPTQKPSEPNQVTPDVAERLARITSNVI